MRTAARLGIVMVVAMACAVPAAPTHGPGNSPTRSPTAPSLVEPTVTSPGSPTSLPTPDDRLPEWIVGRPFAQNRSDDRTELVVGRFGIPGRIELDPGETLVAVLGDRVVGGTLVTDDDDQETLRFAVWSFVTGAHVSPPIEVPGNGHFLGFPAGSDVLVVAGHLPPTRGHGVLSISTVDGSWRWLVPPPAVDVERPVRVLAVSESGDKFATSACRDGMEAAYDCRRLEIRQTSDGALVGRVDTGGEPIARFSSDWLIIDHYGSTGVMDPRGRLLWSNRDLGDGVYFDLVAPLGGRLVAEVRGLDGSELRKLVAFDLLTGESEVLYEAGETAWRFWTALSTDRYVVIGPDFGPPLVGEVVEAGVLDLETGEFDPNAIHLDLSP